MWFVVLEVEVVGDRAKANDGLEFVVVVLFESCEIEIEKWFVGGRKEDHACRGWA